MLLLLLAACVVSSAFPDYQDPVTAGPPLSLPTTASCSVSVFADEPLSGYSQVATAPVKLPPHCPATWQKVLLHWRGSVAGVQFDRYGGLWMGEVEVLRTTTPEPDAAGISWSIDKDITAS